ncbi:hypothetical protein ASF10_03715 [Flavobacterium sp. Leaf82]|uniref:hypothetical protein n=1 Tax=unclassified Flavobacterium TaxID=196869 RepID=UPI0006F9D5FF|nr:hypothetical protein [Flavobacterium sp. Leaf82]KQO29625.1 hypothetical protein ASF10_03715 [Flavobacterium sp. Leaf82]
MDYYDVRGTLLEGKKAVIAVVIPPLPRNNFYGIYEIYNLSDSKENKIVIHFKDLLGEPLKANGYYESFIIDLNDEKFQSINFHKSINVAFHHENGDLQKTPQEIYELILVPKADPNTTGRGTIREGA